MININGLISGIDTDEIISSILEAQNRQIALHQSRKATALSRQAAVNAIADRLKGLRASGATLARSANSVFQSRSVSVSDESQIAAVANSKAAPGIYRLTINSVAQAHQVASQSLTESESKLTHGTIEIRSGSKDPLVLTVDSTNDTVQGFVDTVNAAATTSGVRASLIQNGTGVTVLLSAAETGTDSEISITNNQAASGATADRLEFNLGSPVQAASDASVSLGSGPGAITATSSTNQIDSLIPGVSISLLDATPASAVTLTVSQDSQAAVDAVADFVEGFNGVMDLIRQQTAFNSTTASGGALLGNSTVRQIQDTVRGVALGTIGGLPNNLNRLQSIGVKVTDTGNLEFDESRLRSVLNGGVEGVSDVDVKRLFGLDGVSNSAGVNFVLGSSRTKASDAPYGVEITQAAERATITAGATLAGSTVITAANKTLSLKVDGLSTGTLSLAEGTYTPGQLAAEVERTINASSELKGRTVRVATDGSSLTLTSAAYGTQSQIDLDAGTAWSDLGFTGTETDSGRDVMGHFLVDGEIEAATGRGQTLSGSVDNANTADMQVRVTLTSAQLGTGVEAEVQVSRGVAARLDELLGDILDPVNGEIHTEDERFNATIARLDETITSQAAFFTSQQDRLRKQFLAMEDALSRLQTTSSLLGAQLSQINTSRR